MLIVEMKSMSDSHHRRSVRLQDYDYTLPGAYFVTLVTWQSELLFGEVVDGEVCLNTLGSLVENEWRRLGLRFGQVVLDDFIIMPNHVHGILLIEENDVTGARQKSDSVGARQEQPILSGKSSLASPLPNTPPPNSLSNVPRGIISGSLGAIIGAYKSTTARLINGLRHTRGAPVWQRNYYEHIIRNEAELTRIQAYIQNNPIQWDTDQLHPTAAPNRFNQ